MNASFEQGLLQTLIQLCCLAHIDEGLFLEGCSAFTLVLPVLMLIHGSTCCCCAIIIINRIQAESAKIDLNQSALSAT